MNASVTSAASREIPNPTAPSPDPKGQIPNSKGGAAVLRRLAAALHYRDFRVLWFGALTSTIGTWMQEVALNWLIVTMTGAASAFYLGLDTFLGEAPLILLTLLGGVVADRRDRRQMLLFSQYTQMAIAFTMAALVYFDVIQVWEVLALSVVTGIAQAFGGPAYQSLLPSLVEKEHVPNAIALNSIQFNLARVIGPLLAGAALAAWGMVACFGLNGLSFLAVIVAIFSMHVRHVHVAHTVSMKEQFKSGLRFVRGEPAIIALTILAAATTFLGNPLLTFLPLFARDVFHGDVAQYTELMAFAGAGAVTGALVVAWLGRFKHMGLTLLLFQFMFGLLMVAFAQSRIFLLNGVLLFIAGSALVMVTAMMSSLVQLLAPNEMRGRVMSIYMVAFRGGMPIGSLVAGWIANMTSAPFILSVDGALLSLVAAYFLLKSHGVREL
jgi:MFS family permease